MKNLKEVPADKKKSLGKLPEKVRNKMGYAKQGKMMKAKDGKMVDMLFRPTPEQAEKIMQDPKRKERYKKLMEAKKASEKADKKMMGGEMKSTKGYGAARTSGMGLQDENLIPGKSMDYYKDLM